MVEWLRKSQQKFALLTNGVQWRLIHAGPDYEAWCEWDIALWFEEGEPSDQVRALLHLLSPKALTPPKEGEPAPLVAAIQDTRKGQAELSANLGERVRLAVEHIIHSSGEVIDHLRAESVAVSPRDVYIAATRLVMRCVVVLFAEARELLPRTDPVYNDSYSLQGLRGQLDNFYAVADAEACESCGVCETRCQMEAITSPEGKAVVDRSRCIGCALCLTTCPSGALQRLGGRDVRCLQERLGLLEGGP